MKPNIPVAIAKLSVSETEKFLKEFEQLEVGKSDTCYVFTKPDLKAKGVIPIDSKTICTIVIMVQNDSGINLLRESFTNGKLKDWLKSKKFTLAQKK